MEILRTNFPLQTSMLVLLQNCFALEKATKCGAGLYFDPASRTCVYSCPDSAPVVVVTSDGDTCRSCSEVYLGTNRTLWDPSARECVSACPADRPLSNAFRCKTCAEVYSDQKPLFDKN